MSETIGNTGIRQLYTYSTTIYQPWAMRVSILLDSQGLLECILNDPPLESNACEEFLKKDKRAKHILISLLADQLLKGIQIKNTTKEIWTIIKNKQSRDGIENNFRFQIIENGLQPF